MSKNKEMKKEKKSTKEWAAEAQRRSAQPEVPAVQPEVPAAQPEVPAVQPEVPAAQPEIPAAQPEVPAAQPEVPAAQPEAPAAQPEAPAAQPEAPAAQPEAPAAQPEAPAAKPKASAARSKASGTQPEAAAVQPEVLCDRLSFSAAEAYKLLRTNLMFTIPDEKKCRVIGITSAIRGEGKSTTAINLSYALAETEKRVLLIEADLRLPSVAKKLHMSGKVGLSNLLVHLNGAEEVIRQSDKQKNWDIIIAGSIPPNPSELLGSAQMRKSVAEFREKYDFIILDLPPVNIVSDALVVSDLVDGFLLVVRENYTDKASIRECMHQLEFLEKGKLMGFVITGSEEVGKIYRRYRYSRYGKRTKYGYDGKYAAYGGYEGYGKYGRHGRKKDASRYGYPSNPDANPDAYEESWVLHNQGAEQADAAEKPTEKQTER